MVPLRKWQMALGLVMVVLRVMSAEALRAHRAVFGEPPSDPVARTEYWRRRQDALATNRIPDALEPHEIEFYEWFTIERGHQAWLLGRDTVQFRPTNDFIWLDNGALICEVKSTSATYAAIKRRIRSAVVKAQKHGVTKENFIIDIREQELLPQVRRRLSNINEVASKAKIARLWVWDAEGFEEIKFT